jgi:hypothetical protein
LASEAQESILSRKSRSKGARGELELITVVKQRFPDLDLQRNYDQSALGGCDLIGIPGIALEVKRYQRGNVYRREWWQQACEQARHHEVPVLAYRFDQMKWQAVMPLQWLADEVVNDCQKIALMPFDDFLNELESKWLRKNSRESAVKN